MPKIIAIGGGDFKNRGIKLLDDYIVSTLVNDPCILYLPTANHDLEKGFLTFKEVYEKEYNISPKALYVTKSSDLEIEKSIDSADLIYVGGGDTAYMLDVWKKKSVDVLLKKAFLKGTTLAGLSAGAICWFLFAYTDAKAYNYNGSFYNFKMIEGLSLYPYSCSPHYNFEGRESFNDDIKVKGFAIEDNSMLIINDEEYEVISVGNSSVYFIDPNKNPKMRKISKGSLNDL